MKRILLLLGLSLSASVSIVSQAADPTTWGVRVTVGTYTILVPDICNGVDSNVCSNPTGTTTSGTSQGSTDGFDYFASANLATGELKISSLANASFSSGNMYGLSIFATFEEELLINSDAIASGQDDTLVWTFAISGSFLEGSDASYRAYAAADLGTNDNGGFTNIQAQRNDSPASGDGTYDLTEATLNAATNIPVVRQNGTISEIAPGVWQGTTTIFAASPSVLLFAQIGANGIFDLSQTGAFSLDLRADQSVMSGSNVFLTAPVPLPPAMPALAISLFALSYFTRRQKGK